MLKLHISFHNEAKRNDQIPKIIQIIFWDFLGHLTVLFEMLFWGISLGQREADKLES